MKNFGTLFYNELKSCFSGSCRGSWCWRCPDFASLVCSGMALLDQRSSRLFLMRTGMKLERLV